MAPKVFKIPDGNGGMTYQIQTPDGRWHLTDENGVPLPNESRHEPSLAGSQAVIEKPPRRTTRRRDTSLAAADLPYVQFSMKIPKEDYRILSSYVYWRNLTKGECSRSELLLRAGMDIVRKDKEYREFLKKNPEINGGQG